MIGLRDGDTSEALEPEWGTRSPPADRTSGHGVWERIGHNKFSYRLIFYSFRNDLFDATMDITTALKLSKGRTDVHGRFEIREDRYQRQSV